jgi:hypothetical protein
MSSAYYVYYSVYFSFIHVKDKPHDKACKYAFILELSVDTKRHVDRMSTHGMS